MAKNLEFHQTYTVKSIRKIRGAKENYHIGALPTGRFGIYKYFIETDPYSFNKRDWHRVKTVDTLEEAIAFCK